MLREVAVLSGFTLSETHAFFAYPDAFLQRLMPRSEARYWESPIVSFVLDQVWAKYVQQEVTFYVRTAAIRQTFQREAA